MSDNSLQVAKTICEQMGGIPRLRLMTGAKDFYTLVEPACGVQFKIGRGARDGINAVRVLLDAARDTYTVEFLRLHGTSRKVKFSFEDVYADSLVDLFETTTGFTLQVPRISFARPA
jgi:hypothetical protein